MSSAVPFPPVLISAVFKLTRSLSAGLLNTATMMQVLTLVGSLLVMAAWLPLTRSAEHLAMAGLVIRLHGQIFCQDSGFTGVPEGLLVNCLLL